MKTFVVLGMHRSATTLLSKSMKDYIYMGERMDGHFENKRFMNLNIRILRAAGGNWRNPPSEKAILSLRNRFRDEIAKLVEEESSKAVNAGHAGRADLCWGWKDPRTCLTIKLFHPFLINPHYILMLRKPLDVAKSLKRRNNIPLEKGKSLARIYNTRALKFINDNEYKYFL